VIALDAGSSYIWANTVMAADWKLWGWGDLQWHNVNTNFFCDNQSTGSYIQRTQSCSM